MLLGVRDTDITHKFEASGIHAYKHGSDADPNMDQEKNAGSWKPLSAVVEILRLNLKCVVFIS